MALSRIWTAFILLALLAASAKFLFEPGQEQIFSSLVTGKNTDTIAARTVDAALVPVSIKEQLKQQKMAVWGKEKVVVTADSSSYRAFKMQAANGVFDTTKDAVNLCIGLIGIMALFMGFMSIAEKAGGIRFLSRIIGPFFSRIFPEVPKNHPSMGHMVMNFSANLLGLDNAATPFGIKAMESLQELNLDKEKASNSQLMFLCLHASGLTLVPTVIIADRVALKSAHPTDIFIPCMIATFMATIAALAIVAWKQKIRIFQSVILLWVLGISTVIAALILYIKTLDVQGVQFFSTNLSNGIILLIFLLILLGAIYKKIAIFDAFVDGAKGGFETAIRIIPYLVGLLVAISLLRNSGVFEFVMDGIKQLFIWAGGDTRIVDALPTAILKPLSGSGARAMMIDTLNAHGPDSFAGNLASVFRGSADTTFYIIAVYFGAVGIKNTRYAVGTMLLADLVGIITSILLAYLFFGAAV
ncbi:nucleoside recognition domain-containing protein [Lacibacter sp. H407]|uniref:nucleoside recognition domain-containing protein n=1 Tax=Lacibacter sp. H407 TaxID=3133423 RepID=UPI0030BD1459